MQPIRKTIWKYYIFTFLLNLHFFSAVLVPFFTQWGGISLAQVQLVQSWFMLWTFLLEVPTGVIADKFGRKYSIAIGSLVLVLGALIYGSKPQFEVFLLGELLFAMAFALLSGADVALLYDSLKEAGLEHESKKIFGRAHAIKLFAFLTAALSGGFIADGFGIQAPMIATAIPFLLAAGIAWSIPEPSIGKTVSESKRYLDIAKQGMIFLRGHKQLKLIALDSVVVSSAAYFVIWFYQPLLQREGISIAYFGIVHALLVTSQIVVSSQFTFFERIFGSTKAFIRFTAFITSVAFFMVVIYPHVVTILLFVVLAGGFGLTRIELMTVYMQKLIPSEQRSTILSYISMLRRLGLVFLNPFIGYIADASVRGALFVVALLPLSVFFFSPVEKEIFEEKE